MNKIQKVPIQLRVPADLEPAINTAANYKAGGNKNAYICQLIFKDLNENLGKYQEATQNVYNKIDSAHNL